MSWICPMCSSSNDNTNNKCFVCGEDKPIDQLLLNLKRQMTQSKSMIDSLMNNPISNQERERLATAALLSGKKHWERKEMQNAVECFEKAAKFGSSESECWLGYCYLFGYGCEKNIFKALDLFRVSASKNNVSSQYYLGYCYENGIGVLRSIEHAAEWYEKAADEGHSESKAALVRLKGG